MEYELNGGTYNHKMRIEKNDDKIEIISANNSVIATLSICDVQGDNGIVEGQYFLTFNIKQKSYMVDKDIVHVVENQREYTIDEIAKLLGLNNSSELIIKQ